MISPSPNFLRWPPEPGPSQSCDPVFQSSMITTSFGELCNERAVLVDHRVSVGRVSDFEALFFGFLEYFLQVLVQGVYLLS